MRPRKEKLAHEARALVAHVAAEVTDDGAGGRERLEAMARANVVRVGPHSGVRAVGGVGFGRVGGPSRECGAGEEKQREEERESVAWLPCGQAVRPAPTARNYGDLAPFGEHPATLIAEKVPIQLRRSVAGGGSAQRSGDETRRTRRRLAEREFSVASKRSRKSGAWRSRFR